MHISRKFDWIYNTKVLFGLVKNRLLFLIPLSHWPKIPLYCDLVRLLLLDFQNVHTSPSPNVGFVSNLTKNIFFSGICFNTVLRSSHSDLDFQMIYWSRQLALSSSFFGFFLHLQVPLTWGCRSFNLWHMTSQIHLAQSCLEIKCSQEFPWRMEG